MAQKVAELMQLEQGLAPLFVLGDVNEDGHVNAADAALIEQLASGRSPAAASCPAAADFNLDGKVDSADIDSMHRILERGPVSIPALRFQYRSPCSFKDLLLAARPSATESGKNLVYFLDSRFNTENSKVEVAAGHAIVTPMPSGKGYMVMRSTPGTESEMVTLLITLGTGSNSRCFYYTYEDHSEVKNP